MKPLKLLVESYTTGISCVIKSLLTRDVLILLAIFWMLKKKSKMLEEMGETVLCTIEILYYRTVTDSIR